MRPREALRRGLVAVRRVLLPPPPFASLEVELSFRAHHARWTAPQRRAGSVVALVTWILFSGVDMMNVGPGSGGEAILQEILSLRILGIAAMATGMFLAFRPKFVEDTYSSIVLYLFSCVCYLLLLAMVADIEFPYSYIVDYPGLILYLMFVLGLLRLNAKSFFAIVATVLPFSAYQLYNSDIASVRLGHLMQTGSRAQLTFYANYYYVTTMVYLTSSMIVGYMIAGQLERDARAAFSRENELARVNRDLLSSRREFEATSRALIAAKDALRAAAEQANLDKSKFLADAVHDLSQPTQAVSFLVESARLAMAREDYGAVGTLIARAGQAAQVARMTFNAALEISRLESGLVKPAVTAFGVHDLITEALAPLQVIALAKGVAIRLHAAQNDRAMVSSDRALLARAISNLLANAVKYADSGKHARQAVLVGAVPLPTTVRIDIVDNGIGIPASKLQEVFKPFVQLHNPGHNREKGLGLGLSIVNAIVAVVPGHRLAVRSTEGVGTRFSVYLPRHAGSAVQLVQPGGLVDASADLSSLFVWYVEDDEIARMATKLLLDELGVLTELAGSFEELERELQFTERRPDLVITDYRLPMDRTAEHVIALFAARWGPAMPVIILTGEATHKSAAELGANVAVLRKPTSPQEIIGAIHELCFNRHDDPGRVE